MTILPLTDCCAMLGIDSKTLRHWLTLANLEFIPHPTDARLKCLTMEHIEQLARLHGRPLPSPQSETAPIPDAPALSPSFPQEADLIQKLSCLETRVATLSDQLAQLALTLLQERERTVERRLTALEAVMQEQVTMPILPSPLADREARGSGKVSVGAPKPTRQLHPAEQRARSRMPALIEYSAQGTYVIINSQEGELHLVPDSPQWFDWLATLPSFRFIGKQGRLSAYCDSNHGRPSRSWIAHRNSHNHLYRRRLGVTSRLTIAHLEQTAAKLQADVDTL